MPHDTTLYVIGGLAVIGIASASYLYVEGQEKSANISSLEQKNSSLTTELNKTTTTLTNENNTLKSELEDLKESLEELADNYQDERNRNEDFEDQIRALSGTLGDLDKLASIDEELLMKYSKVSFLNENYTPERLRQLKEDWVAPDRGDEYFHYRAYKHLDDLMDEAEDDGVALSIVSAYRSFDEQGEIKGNFTQIYGTGANAFSADQGYSEHQLGTAVDFSTAAIGYQLEQPFDQTEEFKWLEGNAYKYGFILSYPPDNEFYIYEPWHWRFVGTDLARHIHRSSDTFYTMEQREIDSYRLNFFD